MEVYSFPAHKQRESAECAPFPDQWYSGPWTRKGKALITQFARNPVRGASGKSTHFPRQIRLLDAARSNTGAKSGSAFEVPFTLFSGCSSWPHPVCFWNHTEPFEAFIDRAGKLTWKDLQMVAMLLTAVETNPILSQRLNLRGKLRDLLDILVPRELQ